MMQDTLKKIIEIVQDNFPNGIRDDFIDTSKVLRMYSTNYPSENISRDLIAKVIHENGMEDGGRFYFVSKGDVENIKQFVDKILEAHAIAYYTELYEKHTDFFAQVHIFSPDVLKKILQETDAYFYFTEFFTGSISTRLTYEILKTFTEAETALSLDDLQKKLPYVPAEKILAVLTDTEKYLPMKNGKYLQLSEVQFDTDEINVAKKQILAAIDKNGYAKPEDYDLSINFALNPEINAKDLRNVIYEKFFADEFTKRGRRLFKKGDDANIAADQRGAIAHIRKFVAAHDELTYDELVAFGRKYNPAPSVAVGIAHEKMVRVDKNLFVKDALIKFDVGGIDEALSVFVNGKIISLRAVTSFTGFPSVEGYSWNLFLLESFLRKFSRRYTYNAPAPNSVNVGAIYPKSMKLKDYLDVQAAVVLQENIPLEKSAVEDFLVGQGFRKMRIDKVNQRIIARAQEISNR